MASGAVATSDPNGLSAEAIEHARATAPRLPDIRIEDWQWVRLGDIGSVLCAKVYWRDQAAGWIAEPVSVEGALVGRACDPSDDNAQVTYQYIVQLVAGDSRRRAAHIQPVPHLVGAGYFASPTWCRNLVAYWDGSLRIRSLDDSQFSIDTQITQPDVEGDMPDIHPYAIWSDDCGRLTVPADDDRKTDPISFTIPIHEARSARRNTPQ